MKKLLSTLFVVTLFVISATAQDTVYFQKNSSLRSSGKKKNQGEENIVKIAPLGFISGNIPLYYEREITEFFAIQVGAGVTTHNYIRDIFSSSDLSAPEVVTTKWNDGTSDTYDNQNSLTNYDHRSASLGYYVAVEPRIYFENEGLEGSFIGLSVSRGKYNSSSDKIKTGPSLTGDPVFTGAKYKEYENISDLMVNFGSQTMYDHISLEYSAGVGLRSIKGEKYVYGVNYNNGNYVDGYSEIKKTKIAFSLSFKVGYHF